MSLLGTLPDVCLLLIFEYLPADDLFQLNTICHRWKSLQPWAFSRRRSLVLPQVLTNSTFSELSLSTKFPNLTSLQLSLSFQSLSKLTHQLSPLSTLSNLKLKLYFTRSVSFQTEDTLPDTAFSQLSSIKTLSLTNCSTSHQSIDSLHLGHIFPNIQAVTFIQSSLCTVCGAIQGGQRENSLKCTQLLIKPFSRQCASLLSISVS